MEIIEHAKLYSLLLRNTDLEDFLIDAIRNLYEFEAHATMSHWYFRFVKLNFSNFPHISSRFIDSRYGLCRNISKIAMSFS